ncbi:hypothetical protein IW261DRAFT_1680440 [Armillaria novae-zelandiae]|uniref:Uncharacterized protein n=1 Tax=Armillaria novae-zelandiae TaxID=153914 RepID=A0AA39NKX5_9AGAR|nr:hypothetical protein IW261DRAFT_1680440 [Armillaria novae-zelandiae]
MVQGYPVIVSLGNLPSHICNGQGVGGGRIIGWLPIIKEEAKHKDKSHYADFKRAVWHKAFESILSPIKGKSKFGAWIQVAGGMEMMPCHLYLFPTIMILSANYEEQCMMALTWGSKAKFLCNVCLVPLEELYHANKTYPLQSSAEVQRIYEEAAKIRGATKHNAYLKTFGLRFIKLIFIVHAIFMAAKDHVGSILLRALRVYMELDVYTSLTLCTSDSLRDGWVRIPILASLIEEYEKAVRNEDEAMQRATINARRTLKETKTKNWNFPKAHLHQHLFDDIEAKGITLNYNTKPNESMHSSFKESYQCHTNFKNIDEQIKKEFGDDQVAEGDTRAEDKDKDKQVLASRSANSDEDYTAATSLHGRCGKGGGKLKMKHFESHPEELPLDNGIPAEFASFECQDQISSYGMLKDNYSSIVDWCFMTDILRCSPNFHSRPRYNFILLKTDQGPMFAQLVLVFECVVHGTTYPLMLVRPFGEAVGPMSQKDRDLGFYRVRTKIESNPFIISIYSVIRGALLIKDVTNQGGQPVKDYFVVDMIDADMFLRMQKLSYVGKATDAHCR